MFGGVCSGAGLFRSQSTISRIEDDKTRGARDLDLLADLARALGVPPAVLWLADPEDQARTLDNMDRRDVLGRAVALAVTALLPHGVATAGRIDAAQVARCWTALHRLVELDDQHGGTVYQMAAAMARRLQHALRDGSYQPEVGRDLQAVTAATAEHAAWLAYDAGQAPQARQWWLESCHLADLAGVPDARVTALASMAQQAGDGPGRGKEAVELAQAARVAAGDQASPTLLSVLAAREAVNDAATYPRNHFAYTVDLGTVLTLVGQFDEAIAVTGDAVQRLDVMRGSVRTVTRLHHTVELLGRQNYPPAKSFTAAARRVLPASA